MVLQIKVTAQECVHFLIHTLFHTHFKTSSRSGFDYYANLDPSEHSSQIKTVSQMPVPPVLTVYLKGIGNKVGRERSDRERKGKEQTQTTEERAKGALIGISLFGAFQVVAFQTDSVVDSASQSQPS